MKHLPKILLISPTSLVPHSKPIKVKKSYLPGLTLIQLAAVTPATVDLTLITEPTEDIPWDEHFDIVGLGGMGGSGVVRAYQIAKHFRDNGSKVVMGGE